MTKWEPLIPIQQDHSNRNPAQIGHKTRNSIEIMRTESASVALGEFLCATTSLLVFWEGSGRGKVTLTLRVITCWGWAYIRLRLQFAPASEHRAIGSFWCCAPSSLVATISWGQMHSITVHKSSFGFRSSKVLAANSEFIAHLFLHEGLSNKWWYTNLL